MHNIELRSSVAVYALRKTTDRHEILLLQRANSLVGEWCPISGAIEAAETAWQAALRELAEETGLRPQSLYSADILQQFYEPDRDSICFRPVFVAYVSESDDVSLNHEHSAYQWFSFEEAGGMVPFPSQRQTLSQVEAEFVVRQPNSHLRISL